MTMTRDNCPIRPHLSYLLVKSCQQGKYSIAFSKIMSKICLTDTLLGRRPWNRSTISCSMPSVLRRMTKILLQKETHVKV